MTGRIFYPSIPRNKADSTRLRPVGLYTGWEYYFLVRYLISEESAEADCVIWSLCWLSPAARLA
jgi:hypothetical protein